MHCLIAENRAELSRLCTHHRVRRLELFGSAAAEGDDRLVSDMDFLVEFEEMEPGAYAEAYFGLRDSLISLLDKPVDLVVISAIENPFFLRGIEPNRTLLYAS